MSNEPPKEQAEWVRVWNLMFYTLKPEELVQWREDLFNGPHGFPTLEPAVLTEEIRKLASRYDDGKLPKFRHLRNQLARTHPTRSEMLENTVCYKCVDGWLHLPGQIDSDTGKIVRVGDKPYEAILVSTEQAELQILCQCKAGRKIADGYVRNMTPQRVVGFNRLRKQAVEWIDALEMSVDNPTSRKYKLELRQELYQVDWRKYDDSLPDMTMDLDKHIVDVARTLTEKPKRRRKKNG